MYRWEVGAFLGAIVLGITMGALAVFLVSGWAGLALYVGACLIGATAPKQADACVAWIAIVGGLVVCFWLAHATLGWIGVVLYAAVCGVGSWRDLRRLRR